MHNHLRIALALAIVLLVTTSLLAGCGGGDDDTDDCPAHAAPGEGKRAIPAEPCRAHAH